jgi:hypothetical protein
MAPNRARRRPRHSQRQPARRPRHASPTPRARLRRARPPPLPVGPAQRERFAPPVLRRRPGWTRCLHRARQSFRAWRVFPPAPASQRTGLRRRTSLRRLGPWTRQRSAAPTSRCPPSARLWRTRWPLRSQLQRPPRRQPPAATEPAHRAAPCRRAQCRMHRRRLPRPRPCLPCQCPGQANLGFRAPTRQTRPLWRPPRPTPPCSRLALPRPTRWPRSRPARLRLQRPSLRPQR